MRCWACHKLVILPDIIDGRVAHPGEVRRKERGDTTDRTMAEPPSPGWQADGVTLNYGCRHCGTQYSMSIRVTGKVVATGMQERRERGEGWD